MPHPWPDLNKVYPKQADSTPHANTTFSRRGVENNTRHWFPEHNGLDVLPRRCFPEFLLRTHSPPSCPPPVAPRAGWTITNPWYLRQRCLSSTTLQRLRLLQAQFVQTINRAIPISLPAVVANWLASISLIFFPPFHGSMQLRRYGLSPGWLWADVGSVLLQDGSEGHEVQRVSRWEQDGHEWLRQR